MGDFTMCSPPSSATGGEGAMGATAARGASAGAAGPAAGIGTASAGMGKGVTTGAAPRRRRMRRSPRSSSNSAMSFSMMNSMRSFSSFWFMWSAGRSCGQRNQVPGSRRQHLASVLGDQDDVFHPHAAVPRNVNAGLDGNHHARLQKLLLSLPQPGRLVYLQPHAVPGGMSEVPAVSGGLQHPARGGIHFASGGL